MLQSLGLDGRIRFSTFPYAYCKLLSCFGTILSYVNLCLRVRYKKKKKCMSDNISLKRWYETSFLRECLNLLKFDVDIIEIYLNECFHARSCGSSCGCLYINIYIYIYIYLDTTKMFGLIVGWILRNEHGYLRWLPPLLKHC